MAAFVVAVVALQAYLLSAPAEQLARPIRLASGAELTAVRLDQTAVRTGGTLRVRLYFRGRLPRADEVRLVMTPLSYGSGPEPRPDLSRLSAAVSGLASRQVSVRASAALPGGPYTLRVSGREPTFGSFQVLDGR